MLSYEHFTEIKFLHFIKSVKSWQWFYIMASDSWVINSHAKIICRILLKGLRQFGTTYFSSNLFLLSHTTQFYMEYYLILQLLYNNTICKRELIPKVWIHISVLDLTGTYTVFRKRAITLTTVLFYWINVSRDSCWGESQDLGNCRHHRKLCLLSLL